MIELLSLDTRICAFAKLGSIMGRAAAWISSGDIGGGIEFPEMKQALERAVYHNPWFTTPNIAFALSTWSDALTEESLREWLENYKKGIENSRVSSVAVIMAGNIPMVGFHDFLCVLIKGHRFIGKLSSDDNLILPAIADVLTRIEPGFMPMIRFTEGKITDFDAIIATGSNNTARYFEYYFAKYPHIIRRNRNGVAVLSGNENETELLKLGTDICSYFGLGCRNVSKVFLPEGFKPEKLFTAIEPFKNILGMHNKYMNNYSYHRSVFLLNSIPHLDNGVFILTGSSQYSSPIPVLYYEFYNTIESVKEKLLTDEEHIQCIANEIFTSNNTVRFGETQHPGLGDYADGIDTLKFLIEL